MSDAQPSVGVAINIIKGASPTLVGLKGETPAQGMRRLQGLSVLEEHALSALIAERISLRSFLPARLDRSVARWRHSDTSIRRGSASGGIESVSLPAILWKFL